MNQVSPIKDSEFVVCGAVSTRSCVPFHNGLLRENLLRIGGADNLHMNDTCQVLANSQCGSGTGRAI